MFSFLKKLHTTGVFLLFLSLCSCEYIEAVDELTVSTTSESNIIYLIKKGQHSSTSSIQKISGASMRYEITFDSSAVYQTSILENQGDINKLFGTSDCGSQHHTNSARFGWRWYNNRLEIHAYTYLNKERSSKLVSTVELGRPYVYEIRFEDEQYVYLLNDVRITMSRNCTGSGDGYMLYPYFGGDETAPHDITITLNKLQ